MNPCSSCDVFVADPNKPATGTCHRHPPDSMTEERALYRVNAVPMPTGLPASTWPTVDADGPASGCGDWIKKSPHAETAAS